MDMPGGGIWSLAAGQITDDSEVARKKKIHRTLSRWTKEEDQLWGAARDGKDGEI